MKRSKVRDIRQRAGRRLMETLADDYASGLPFPSARFQRLTFIYPENLATAGRELLFDQLNRRANELNYHLVITDVGYDRCGFYVKIDELGGNIDAEADFDGIVESWSLQESNGNPPTNSD